MSSDAWDRPAGSYSWAEAHPGQAALAATVATYAGLALVAFGASVRVAEVTAGRPAPVWVVPLLIVGAAVFVVALPAALGFAAACCATQRELVGGVVAGLSAAVLAIVVLALLAVPMQVIG